MQRHPLAARASPNPLSGSPSASPPSPFSSSPSTPIVHHPDSYTTRLINDRLFLIPHAAAALLAMLLGPFLFSTRFRSRHLKRHRIMGRVYVICIAIAAPLALYLQLRRP